jgi:hypothetical protein
MLEISHELALLHDNAELESKAKAAAEQKREEAAAARADVSSVELLQECAACRTRAADASRCV